MQKHYATKASPQVRIKKRKNCPSLVQRYATIPRHLNVVKIILHGTFDDKKGNTFLMLELCLQEHGAF